MLSLPKLFMYPTEPSYRVNIVSTVGSNFIERDGESVGESHTQRPSQNPRKDLAMTRNISIFQQKFGTYERDRAESTTLLSHAGW